MSKEDNAKANADLMYWVGRITFPLFLVASLIAMVSAERVSAQISRPDEAWFTHIEIAVPWFLTAVTGANIWVNARRAKIDRQLAGNLLGCVGAIAALLYGLLDRFAQLH